MKKPILLDFLKATTLGGAEGGGGESDRRVRSRVSEWDLASGVRAWTYSGSSWKS